MRIDGVGSIPSYTPPERAAGTPARPAERPDELRAVLSAAELDYFADLEKLGPVTYGRRGARVEPTLPPAILGQRIDVRA